jgi:uncharacterized phage-like protein YoqJ
MQKAQKKPSKRLMKVREVMNLTNGCFTDLTISQPKKLSITGHRPDKLSGYSDAARLRLVNFATETLRNIQPEHVITGVALGWDQAIAWACVDLKIPFTAAIPFAGQERMWPQQSRDEYSKLLEKAAEEVIVCPGGYHPLKMQVRNQWMVNNGDYLLALWDGSMGGTANCVNYAKASIGEDRIINCWPDWQRYNG